MAKSCCKLFTFFLTLSSVLLLTATSARALDIVSIEFLFLEDRVNGVPGATPHMLEVEADGTNIDSINVTTPVGSTVTDFSLSYDSFSGDWEYESINYATTGALTTAYNTGDYIIDIIGDSGASTDQITLTFNPTQPSGFISGQSPSHGATGVSTSPTVTWNDCSSCGGNYINMWVINTVTGDDEDMFSTTDTSETTWNVGAVLDGNTLHELEVGIANRSVTTETTALLSDSLQYTAGWENIDITEFSTVPEPATGLSLLMGLVGLAFLRRTA
jgi:hypothetical protein